MNKIVKSSMNEIVKIEEFFFGELVHINLPIEKFCPLCYYEGKVMKFEGDFTKVLFPHQGEVYKIKTTLLERTPAKINKQISDGERYRTSIYSYDSYDHNFQWDMKENTRDIKKNNVVKNIIKTQRTYEIEQNPGLFIITEVKNVICKAVYVFDQEAVYYLSTNSLIPILNEKGKRIEKDDLTISYAKNWQISS